MKQHFYRVCIQSNQQLHMRIMNILIQILQSGTMYRLIWDFILSQPVQTLFMFLLTYLRLLDRIEADFLHTVFTTVLRLYLTTHGDRCVYRACMNSKI